MISSTSKIAILLATYNGGKYLNQQIDSILNQTNQNWELFIHDDGSKDNTKDILANYKDTYSNKIHILDDKPTGGSKQNFFYLMNNVEADYIMFCDQDDIWQKNKIELTLKKMIEVEADINKPALVFTDLMVVNEDLSAISSSMAKYQSLNYSNIDFNSCLIQNVVTGCTTMINKSLLLTARTNNTENIIMHDWWCALIASKYGNIGFVNTPTIMYRQHGDNSVGAKNMHSVKYLLNRLFDSKEIKKGLDLTRNQAKKFVGVFNLDSDDIAYKYSQLDNLNKINRLSFYIKNKIWKSGFKRNIGLILFG